MEYVTPILIRIFNTRDSLVTFLKTIIDVELASTGMFLCICVGCHVNRASADATDLLRGANMRTRFTAMSAQQHGYHYLRTVVKKLLSLLMRYPPTQSFDIEPSAGENLQGNVARLKAVTQEFIQVLVESASQVPL